MAGEKNTGKAPQKNGSTTAISQVYINVETARGSPLETDHIDDRTLLVFLVINDKKKFSGVTRSKKN